MYGPVSEACTAMAQLEAAGVNVQSMKYLQLSRQAEVSLLEEAAGLMLPAAAQAAGIALPAARQVLSLTVCIFPFAAFDMMHNRQQNGLRVCSWVNICKWGDPSQQLYCTCLSSLLLYLGFGRSVSMSVDLHCTSPLRDPGEQSGGSAC